MSLQHAALKQNVSFISVLLLIDFHVAATRGIETSEQRTK